MQKSIPLQVHRVLGNKENPAVSEERSEQFGPADFDLVVDDAIPAAGEAILKKWMSHPHYYSAEWPEDKLADALEIFLRKCMCGPFSLELQEANKFAPKVVKWVPGHLIGNRQGYGPEPADIMIVSNVPSEKEVENSRLWIGAAANLTAEVFEDNFLDLTKCFGTYVNKFRYPYPNMTSMPAAWKREGEFFLHQEIRIVKPKFILLMGADAVKAVFGRGAKLKTYRGVVTDYCGAKVMVTNNPSDLVRNPEKTALFKQDVRDFATLVNGKSKDAPPVTYHYLWNEEQLRAAIQKCEGKTVFAMDCEWNGNDHIDGHLLTIQWSCAPQEAFVVCLRSDVSKREFYPSQSTAIRLLKEMLDRLYVEVTGHNFRADMKFLQSVGIDLTQQFSVRGFDTMLAHHLLEENAEHNLTSCSLADTDIGRYDEVVQAYLDKGIMHWEMPDEVLHPYGAADADATFRLYMKYADRLWKEHVKMCDRHKPKPESPEAGVTPLGSPDWVPSVWNLFRQIVMPVNAAILEMEMTGIVTDRERVLEMADAFAQKRDYILDELRVMISEPDFNPRSTPQVKRLLFGKPGSECVDGFVHTQLGLKPIKTTGKRAKMWNECELSEEVYYLDEPEYGMRDGKHVMVKEAGWNSDFHSPSTDSETLAVLADDYGSREAALLRAYRIIDQICKNFLTEPEEVEGDEVFLGGMGYFIKRDGRIHSTFSQLTETGRYRSSKPNVQNIPKGREGDLSKIFRPWEKVPPIRTCMMAPPGHLLIEADFESAELFTLAWIANDERMKRDLELKDERGAAISLHTVTAINIFKLGMTPAEFDAARKGNSADAKYYSGLRVAAKSVNFGGNLPQVEYTGQKGVQHEKCLSMLQRGVYAYQSWGARASAEILQPLVRLKGRQTYACSDVCGLWGAVCSCWSWSLYVVHRLQKNQRGQTIPKTRLQDGENKNTRGRERRCAVGKSQPPVEARGRTQKHQIQGQLSAGVFQTLGMQVLRVWGGGRSSSSSRGRGSSKQCAKQSGSAVCWMSYQGPRPQVANRTAVHDSTVQLVAVWPNQNRGKNGDAQQWVIRGEGESQPQRLGGEIILPRGRDTLYQSEKIVWTARITHMKVQKFGIKSPGDNKSIPYQRGAKAIARQVLREGVECTASEAQEWIDNFYDNYEKVGAFIEFCKESVFDPEYLVTPYGRVRHFHYTSDEAVMAAQQREACNFP